MPQPLIVPTDLSGGGTALPRYRELLADELGFLQATTVTTAATSGEARRVVLADELRDDEAGYGFLGSWLYVRTGVLAGTQRRILNDSDAGYQGTSSAVVLSRTLDAPLAVGTVVDITGPLPIKRHIGVKGLNDCANEAMARCPVRATLTLTGGNSDRLALDDYPFLVHDDQILSIRDRYGTIGVDSARPTGLPYRIDANGASRYLVFGRWYSSGETVEVQVSLPGDRLVYDGTTWAVVTDAPGLHDDNDRGAVPEHWVLAFGMVAALRFLERQTARRRDVDTNERADMLGEIRERLGQWAVTAQRLRLTEFPRGLPRRPASLIGTTLTRTESTVTDPVGSAWP